MRVVSAQQKDPLRARLGANPREGSVKGMSPLDLGIIRNGKIRSRIMIPCQLMENSLIEGFVQS